MKTADPHKTSEWRGERAAVLVVDGVATRASLRFLKLEAVDRPSVPAAVQQTKAQQREKNKMPRCLQRLRTCRLRR